MKLKVAFVAVFLVLGVLILSWSFSKKNALPPNEPIVDSKINSFVENNVDVLEDQSLPESFGDVESEAYSFGFKKGRDAFIIQSKDPNGLPPTTKEEYAVFIEKYDDKEKEYYQEAMLRGYVDGYHKATETMYCPGK